MAEDVRQLVAQCLRGDQVAVADLVARYEHLVFGLCYRILGHRQDAEDVTQESFVRAIRSLSRWDPGREFKPWLLAIAGNRCRTLLALRSRRPQPVAEVDHLPDHRPDMAPARQLAEEVERGLAELRREYRQAFLLFHADGLSYQEIAEALDCPLGTVKTWVHRARRELAEMLREREVVEERPDAS